MLNDRKVRLMSKLALYETGEGKEDIKLSKYYKTDYARLQVLKTALCITFAYILILAMYVLYNLEYFIEDAVIIDWKGLGKNALGIYAALMTVYLISTLLGYSIKYSISRKKLAKYFRMLKRLKQMYTEEEEGVTEEVTVTEAAPKSKYMEEELILSEDELKEQIQSIEKEEVK